MIGFDKFPCIVFLLSDNKAFSIGVFSLIHFVEYSARFLGPRFLFLCVALGKSIEICHIHFESDQPNYNPECELGLGFFRMQGRLVSFLDTTEITHPIHNYRFIYQLLKTYICDFKCTTTLPSNSVYYYGASQF